MSLVFVTLVHLALHTLARACLSLCLRVYVSFGRSVCLFVWLSVCLSSCFQVCLQCFYLLSMHVYSRPSRHYSATVVDYLGHHGCRRAAAALRARAAAGGRTREYGSRLRTRHERSSRCLSCRGDETPRKGSETPRKGSLAAKGELVSRFLGGGAEPWIGD